MGQRMRDEPHVYGDNCLLGFPAGKTPKYVYVRFSKIVKCPDPPWRSYFTPPNDRVFKLTQIEDDACFWHYQEDKWIIWFRLMAPPAASFMYLIDTHDNSAYFQDAIDFPLQEGTVYHNEITACTPFTGAAGGFAAVTWTQEATNLLESINMQRANDLFMEMRPLCDGNKIYKFCRLKDATNIAIEFEP